MFTHLFARRDGRALMHAHRKIKDIVKEIESLEDDDEIKASFIFLAEKIKNYTIVDYCGGKHFDLIRDMTADEELLQHWLIISRHFFALLTQDELRSLRDQCLSAALNASVSYKSLYADQALIKDCPAQYWAGYWLSKSILTKPILRQLIRRSIRQILDNHPFLYLAFSL